MESARMCFSFKFAGSEILKLGFIRYSRQNTLLFYFSGLN